MECEGKSRQPKSLFAIQQIIKVTRRIVLSRLKEAPYKYGFFKGNFAKSQIGTTAILLIYLP